MIGSEAMIHGADDMFDAEWYMKEYPDVARSGLAPAEHYSTIGKRLGRAPVAALSARPDLDEVRYVISKKAQFSSIDEVALLVTHAPGGRLKPHVLPYMKQLSDAGLSVVLVAVVDRPLQMLEEEVAIPTMMIVRDNAGYDFGAWAHAFRLCPTLFRSGLLIMTNDSVIPTADPAAFQAMMARVRGSKANISGLTANHEYGWHVQSYFLAIKRKALASAAFQHFIGSVRRIDDKDEVIRQYELTFSARMQAAGLTVDAVYHGPYPNNPVIWSWRELVEGGFPFIKLLLLRKIMGTYTDDKEMLDELHQTWPTVLNDAGFDVRLVRSAIRAADMSRIPEGPNKDLLHDPKSFKT
jgi:hypothetical protein